MKKEQLLARLGWEDPFENFTPGSAPDSWSWHYDHEFLETLYRRIPQPGLVVEVGTWLGRSAIEASKFYATRLNWRPFTLICVDTWLGSAEHWTQPIYRNKNQSWDQTPDQIRDFPRVNGYPVIYEQFLSNVVYSGLQELILPLPQTSLNASRILYFHQLQHQLQFDWVYLDASHDTMDVLMDMSMYWPLIRPGGLLFGDDWNWNQVRTAVVDFCELKHLDMENSYHTWAIWKP